MKIIITICRILVGSLFIVSGLIKSNDAWGFYYKLEEYFHPGAFDMEWLLPYALGLAIFVCVAEVLLGVAILVGAKPKLTMVLTFIMMIFFTWLTAYTDSCDPNGTKEIINASGQVEEIANQCVLECGCFGNAIPLEAHESFLKDVFILIFCIPIGIGAFMNKIQLNTSKEDIVIYALSLAFIAFFSLYFLDWLFPVLFTAICFLVATAIKRRLTSKHKEWIIAGGIAVVCAIFQWYTLAHLPIKDYRPYAVGEDILYNMKSAAELGKPEPEYATVYSIQHKTTKKDSTMLSTDWLKSYNEDWFKNNWEVTSYDGESVLLNEDEAYEPPILDFQIVDYDSGEDIKETVLGGDRYSLMHVSNTLEDTRESAQADINELAKTAMEKGVQVFAMTNALQEEANAYQAKHKTAYPFYNCDQTELKIIVRANPGLVLLDGATVVKKWAARDIPDWDEVAELMK